MAPRIRRDFIRMNRRIANNGELIFVIKDSNGSVFGGFMSTSFGLRKAFFGTGDSFIFKIVVCL